MEEGEEMATHICTCRCLSLLSTLSRSLTSRYVWTEVTEGEYVSPSCASLFSTSMKNEVEVCKRQKGESEPAWGIRSLYTGDLYLLTRHSIAETPIFRREDVLYDNRRLTLKMDNWT